MGLFGKKKTSEKRDERDVWGSGIPNYTEADLMTETDKLNFAMNIVKQNELDVNGFTIIAATDQPGQVPNFVCEKDGKKWFIVVKCSIAPDMPTMGVEEKMHIIEHAKKFGAEAYFAPVGIGACDAIRFDASLALKNDAYYANYIGLEKVQPKKSTEWIQRALAEIDLLAPKPEPPRDTSVRYSLKVPSDVRYSLDVEWSDFDEWKSQLVYPTFQEMLMTCIERKGMSNQDFYKAAFLDRKLFSAIKNNKDYQPKKETAVACCFGLDLCLADSEKLLELAGYKLSLAITWDRVIYYCLKNRIMDIDVVNELLYEQGEKCIRV